MKAFERTTTQGTSTIPAREALAEINHAMMEGKRDVREMEHGGNHTRIAYKDGSTVTFNRIDVADDHFDTKPEPVEGEVADWGGTFSNWEMMHRMFLGETRYGIKLRARCSKGILGDLGVKGNRPLRTKSQILNGKYADHYTFCPRCETK